MNKNLAIISGLIVLLITGGYLFIRFKILKATDFKPERTKQKNIIDLRPSIIAKLQQLVKDGSDGLYILTIEKINPDVFASKLDVINASIYIDTAVMLQLDTLKKLPDNIFTMHFDSLHIDGIGIDEFLHKSRIDIAAINLNRPVIEVYHTTRAYNESEREQNDTLSLYHRIKGQMNRIEVGGINIYNGAFISHETARKKSVTKFSNITIRISDLLMDSSTQFDAKRFLFAKHLTIEAKNYVVPTADSLYYFKTGTISIAAEQSKVTFLNIELNPRVNRREFQNKSHFRKMIYNLVFPEVTLYGVDWLALMNHQRFVSKKAEISGGILTTFLDKSPPHNPVMQTDNFPQQMLMKIPLPVSISSLDLKHVNISYEEYNPDALQSGTVFFDNITGQLDNLSNVPAIIKKYPVAKFSGSGLFMHHIPIKAGFTFNLLKYKTGEFTADVHMDTLDNLTINPLAGPLGLVLIKSGQMQEGTVHIEGNNFKAKSQIAISYTDLSINPLKKAGKSEDLKRKRLAGFIANVILLKKANPEKGKDLRRIVYSTKTGHHGNFFNMIWITILTGILKTIGIPVTLVIH